MNQTNRIVDSIQYELEKLRTLGIDVSILEKEVYKLSIPEDIETKDILFLRVINFPIIPKGPSTTYGVFKNILQEEPTIYISLNSKNDCNLDLKIDELNIWTEDEGSLFDKEI